MPFEIKCDIKNSIVFDDTLDLLLNRGYDSSNNNNSKGNQECVVESRWINASKYARYEFRKGSNIDKECSKICDGKKACAGTELNFTGGLILPKRKDESKNEYTEGSGNTIIVGDYGTGKSTLAFQMAAACANEINQGIALYYALESTYEQTIDNFVMSGQEARVKPFYYLPNTEVGNEVSPKILCDRLKEVLKEKEVKEKDSGEEKEEKSEENKEKSEENKEKSEENKEKSEENKEKSEENKVEIKPQVLIPRLSPRGLNYSAESSESFFIKRYKELENMLSAISYYNEKEENVTKIKLVAIDSLTVFGDKPLLREEIYRLFDLFKRNNILGVFTIENCEEVDIVGTNYVDSIKFRADVVISLSKSYYNNYYQTYFEIEKSRNIQQVYGKHPYKIRQNSNEAEPVKEEEDETEGEEIVKEEEDKTEGEEIVKEEEDKTEGEEIVKEEGNRIERKKLEIYPSLHYILSGTEDPIEEDRQKKASSQPKDSLFGIEAMSNILPDFFDHGRSKIITITGNSGLFKSDLALNFLMNGLAEGDNCLIIRLNDREFFETDGLKFNKDVYQKMKAATSQKGEFPKTKEKPDVFLVKSDAANNELASYRYKYSMNEWGYLPKGSKLYEIVLKNGLLLPEEFVNVICNIINQNEIKRIAFVDLKTIGVSYPFLVNSENAGGLFLPTFIHLMRNYGVHVVISTSPSDIVESDKEVKKAIALSDAVIRIEMKGKSDIYITGIGNMVKGEEYLIQLLPKQKARFSLHKDMGAEGETAFHPYEMFEVVKRSFNGSAYVQMVRSVIGHDVMLQAGGGIVAYDQAAQKVMLGYRIDNDCWGIPGGTVDLDELPEEAARREFREEMGSEFEKVLKLMGVFVFPEVKSVNGDIIYRIYFAYFYDGKEGEFIRKEVGNYSEEFSVVQWFSMKELLSLNEPPSLNEPVDKVIIQHIPEFLEESNGGRSLFYFGSKPIGGKK